MRLKAWLKKQGVRQTVFAETIGYSDTTVHRVVTGKLYPNGDLADAIKRATRGKVMPNDLLNHYLEQARESDLADKGGPTLAT